MNRLIIASVITLIILGGLLAGAAYAADNGVGLIPTGVSGSSPSARGGSIYGIFFLGGGPGSGK